MPRTLQMFGCRLASTMAAQRRLCSTAIGAELDAGEDDVAERLDESVAGGISSDAGGGEGGGPDLTTAVRLLLEQEDQGIAADVTQDVLTSTILHDSRLHEAVLAFFVAGKDAAPNTETFASLIYVCVKLRRLDEAFRHFEAMMDARILPDSRTYAHLLKGCGRARQVRRGEAFFLLLKERGAPSVYDARVYNAVINMHCHSKTRGQHLLPKEAAPAWEAFEEMQARGIAPDAVTYNSLIALCGRTSRPEVERALRLLAEMDEIGVPITDVTASATMQVLGRAHELELGRTLMPQLLERGFTPSTATWRPLLHSSATRGDRAGTQRLYDEMVAATGSNVFDSFRHRVSHASNYLVLAAGRSEGYAAARAEMARLRAAGSVDLLTYGFMIDLALTPAPGKGGAAAGGKGQAAKGEAHGGEGSEAAGGGAAQAPAAPTPVAPQSKEERAAAALALWDEMAEDGLTPSAALVHKMFHVWVGTGRAHVAEQVFEEMKSNSASLKARGADLAQRWLGGDLSGVADALQQPETALTLQMCHSSRTYVRLIDAYTAHGDGAAAGRHLADLQAEAAEKGIALGHELTTPLLTSFCRAGAPRRPRTRGRPPRGVARRGAAVRGRAVACPQRVAAPRRLLRRGGARAPADGHAAQVDGVDVCGAPAARRAARRRRAGDAGRRRGGGGGRRQRGRRRAPRERRARDPGEVRARRPGAARGAGGSAGAAGGGLGETPPAPPRERRPQSTDGW